MADEENRDGVESLLSPKAKSEATRLMRGLLGGAPKPTVDLNPDHQPTLAPDAPEPEFANEAAFKIDPDAQIQPLGPAEVVDFPNRQEAPSEEVRQQLKAAKGLAIEALKDMINDARANNDSTLVRKLEAMLKNVIDSRDPKAVANLVASAQTAVSQAAGKGDDDKVVDINSLYKDPIFAARMKEIGDAAAAIDKKTDDGLAKLNKHVKEHGYSTSVDAEIRDLDEKIEKEKEVSKQLELRIQRAELRKKQQEELERQMRERGDTKGLELLYEGKEVVEDAKAKLLKKYKEAQETILKFTEKRLRNDPNETEESRARELDKLAKQQKSDLIKLSSKTEKEIAKEAWEIQKDIESRSNYSSAYKTAANITPPTTELAKDRVTGGQEADHSPKSPPTYNNLAAAAKDPDGLGA